MTIPFLQTIKDKAPLFIDTLKGLPKATYDVYNPLVQKTTEIFQRKTPIQQKISSFFRPEEEKLRFGGFEVGKETGNVFAGGIGIDPFVGSGIKKQITKQVENKIVKPVFQGLEGLSTKLLEKFRGMPEV